MTEPIVITISPFWLGVIFSLGVEALAVLCALAVAWVMAQSRGH